MINTHVHITPILHSPVGESPASKTLSESAHAPLKPVEPATASERSRLRAPRKEVDLERKSSVREAYTEDEDQEKAREKRLEREKLEQDRAQISELASRDREVRAHEQAHVAVGGQYAGAARYQYERGPDGVNYAVSGEVSIDVSKAATPEETIAKAQVVRRAALAPAEPSSQDLRVAAQATRIEQEARKELALERAREAREKKDVDQTGAEKTEQDSASVSDKNRLESDKANRSDMSRDDPLMDSLAINSRFASSIASLTSPKVGSVLDQLA